MWPLHTHTIWFSAHDTARSVRETPQLHPLPLSALAHHSQSYLAVSRDYATVLPLPQGCRLASSCLYLWAVEVASGSVSPPLVLRLFCLRKPQPEVASPHLAPTARSCGKDDVGALGGVRLCFNLVGVSADPAPITRTSRFRCNCRCNPFAIIIEERIGANTTRRHEVLACFNR